MTSILKKFMRKKVIDRHATSTELHRVLTTVDLTFLGIGSTLGIGVYVLAGSVAKDSAGPAVVISFLVAAIASVLAGLCYAEFGARVPKAGSAYVYSYVCVGELIAFIVGWNLIMEYVIGVASVAKGYSGYVDQLFGHALSTTFHTYLPINVGFLSDYFDAFAFGITILLTFLLAFGVKESTFFNNIFTALNLFVVLFVVVAGSIYAKPDNWMLKKEDIFRTNPNITADKVGEGGFAPFGFHGIMKGAATCFYGFVGFDCIATTGEEAKNPQRAIPFAIIFSLLFIFLAYFGISSVITMMVPYYLQDAEAPLPFAFSSVGFSIGQWVVTIGALFGLSTSLLGSMFPMPRVIYSMAKDGVLFNFLSKVHSRFQTPLIATLLAGSFGGLMAAIFKLEALIDMMSIGTLTAYTLVAVCVLCLRYRKDVDGADDCTNEIGTLNTSSHKTLDYFKQTINSQRLIIPSELSSSYTNGAVVMYCFCTICFCSTAIFGEEALLEGDKLVLALLVICGMAMVLCMISLALQPVSRVSLSFRVPFVPVVPAASILANTYLIMKLSAITWIRFSVWMGVGFIIYAICLCNGTTDKCYQASIDEKRKRKLSKISASGFENNGLEFSHEILGSKEDKLLVQNCEKITEDNPFVSKLHKRIQGDADEDIVVGHNYVLKPCKRSAAPIETETIEKTLEFDDTPELLSDDTNDDDDAAEKAALQAIDSVISQAYSAAGHESKASNESSPNGHIQSEKPGLLLLSSNQIVSTEADGIHK